MARSCSAAGPKPWRKPSRREHDACAVSGAAPRPLRRNRDFVLLWTGQATSALGSQLSQVAYPLLVLSLGHSATAAGIVGFARNLPIFVLSLPAGALADHVERRRLMQAVS